MRHTVCTCDGLVELFSCVICHHLVLIDRGVFVTLCFADRPEKVEYTGDLARSTIEATDGSDGTNLLGRKSAAQDSNELQGNFLFTISPFRTS